VEVFVETAEIIVRDVADIAARLSLWPSRALSERTNDLGRLRDLLLLVEREVLNASAAEVSEVATPGTSS
jgi:hypothetical protein